MFILFYALQERNKDKLAEAMAHVHGEANEESVEDLDIDVSETVETSELSGDLTEALSENQNLAVSSLETTEVDHVSDDQYSENEQTGQVKRHLNIILYNFLSECIVLIIHKFCFFKSLNS